MTERNHRAPDNGAVGYRGLRTCIEITPVGNMEGQEPVGSRRGGQVAHGVGVEIVSHEGSRGVQKRIVGRRALRGSSRKVEGQSFAVVGHGKNGPYQPFLVADRVKDSHGSVNSGHRRGDFLTRTFLGMLDDTAEESANEGNPSLRGPFQKT